MLLETAGFAKLPTHQRSDELDGQWPHIRDPRLRCRSLTAFSPDHRIAAELFFSKACAAPKELSSTNELDGFWRAYHQPHLALSKRSPKTFSHQPGSSVTAATGMFKGGGDGELLPANSQPHPAP